MAMTLTLDTSAYTAFKLGDTEAVRVIQLSEKIIVPIVVYGELLAGFEMGSKREQNRLELRAFFQSPRVQLGPITAATAERYAHIYAYLRRAGKPIPTNNLWIAASAMEHSAELLTRDRHFSHIPQILVRTLA
jgi:tRNA(fMet)-specific endonuclease VapC